MKLPVFFRFHMLTPLKTMRRPCALRWCGGVAVWPRRSFCLYFNSKEYDRSGQDTDTDFIHGDCLLGDLLSVKYGFNLLLWFLS